MALKYNITSCAVGHIYSDGGPGLRSGAGGGGWFESVARSAKFISLIRDERKTFVFLIFSLSFWNRKKKSNSTTNTKLIRTAGKTPK